MVAPAVPVRTEETGGTVALAGPRRPACSIADVALAMAVPAAMAVTAELAGAGGAAVMVAYSCWLLCQVIYPGSRTGFPSISHQASAASADLEEIPEAADLKERLAGLRPHFAGRTDETAHQGVREGQGLRRLISVANKDCQGKLRWVS
jgi:hypothetical protein